MTLLPIPMFLRLASEYPEFLLKECGLPTESIGPKVMVFEEVITFLPEGEMKVAHLGCGQGELLVFLAKNFPSGSYAGVDADATKIAMAQHLADRLNIKVDFQTESLGTIGLPSERYNLVIVENLEDSPEDYWEQWLAESVRITVSKGHWLLHHLHREGVRPRFCPARAFILLLELGVWVDIGTAGESTFFKGSRRYPVGGYPSEAHA